MTAKYQKIPQMDFEEERVEVDPEGHHVKYASPFTYSSIFTYDNSKMFKSPFTYASSFAKQATNSFQLEKDNKESLTRSIVETLVIVLCFGIFVMSFPLSLLICLKFVSQFERLVVFRLGRLQDAKGPGAVMILPCIDSYKRIDMRTKAFNVPPLHAITSDGGVIELGATVFYRVKDVLSSVLNVQDFNKALRNLAHSIMHRLVNKHSFQEVEKDRKFLRDELQAELNKAAFGWGMEVGNIEMSEMRVISQPEPRANAALRTLMQPQFLSTIFQAVSGIENGNAAAAGAESGGGGDGAVTSGSPTTSATPIPLAEFAALHRAMTATGNNPAKSAAAEEDDLTKMVNLIQSALCDSLADEVGHSYQIECRGLGDFYMHLKKPIVCVGTGKLEKMDVTIALERQDLMDLLSEKLAPLDAYLSGRISISGDPTAAFKMKPLATRLKPLLRANAALSAGVCDSSSSQQKQQHTVIEMI